MTETSEARRVRLDTLLPEECAINRILRVLDGQPPAVQLLDAQRLLLAARDCIADYIEHVHPVRRHVWSGLMAGFVPAETDTTTTGTFDQGGPVTP